MGKARFIFYNLITAESMLAVSSLRAGIVTSALKEGSGSAILNPGGSFTGSVDLEYIAEIDSISGGAEVGQATFKWSDGTGGWNERGVTTSASNLTLNNGVMVNFTTGSGADFFVGDRWYFKGVNLFNAGKMIDLDRDHRYRSATLGSPNTITVTFGSALEVMALVLFDHNLTSGATIVLKGNTADSWAAPAFSEVIAWSSEKIIHFLSAATTYRYWQLQITDAGNTDGHIEIGELFLGSYLELSKNYNKGFSRDRRFLKDTNETPYGIRRHRFYNTRKIFSYDFNVLPTADITSLETLIDSICSRSAGTFQPFWFVPDSASPNDSHLVEIGSLPVKHRSLTWYDTPLQFEEVMTSV